jgi:hypothetical protein
MSTFWHKCLVKSQRTHVAHLAAAFVGVALAFVAVKWLGGSHAEIIKAALKAPGAGSASNRDVSKLIKGADSLADDALLILVPVVSLASGIGGIMWALGSQRGQGIVIGALVAGASAVMVKGIVS